MVIAHGCTQALFIPGFGTRAAHTGVLPGATCGGKILTALARSLSGAGEPATQQLIAANPRTQQLVGGDELSSKGYTSLGTPRSPCHQAMHTEGVGKPPCKPSLALPELKTGSMWPALMLRADMGALLEVTCHLL